MSDRSDLAAAMEPVARAVWGDPNKAQSKPGKPRWGNSGSREVNLAKGTWFDHENQVGGGVIDLVKKEKGLSGKAAIEFIEQAAGMKLDDGRRTSDSAPRSRRENGSEGPPDRDEAPPWGEEDVSTPARQERSSKRKIAATYDYTDAAGTLLYQVVRWEPKGFSQRRPDPKKPGQWIWNLEGLGHGLYRMSELREAIAADEVLALAEGEKDVDNLWKIGIAATTNSGGAKHWSADHAETFRGRDIIITIDNDETGRKRGDMIAKTLDGVARRVRVLDPAAFVPELAEKGDISDWIEMGATAQTIFEAAATLKPWAPTPFQSKLGGRYVGDFAETAIRRDWIVKKALLARTLNLMIGEPGCGKSFLTLDLAMTLGLSVVDEKHPKVWFRRKIKPCGVAYIAGEGQEDFIFRMRAWLSAKGLPLNTRMPVVLIPTALDLRTEEGKTNDLIEEIKARSEECLREFGVPIELLVIDTVSKAMAGGDDVKPEHIGAFFRNCQRIQQECGTTTMAVHHTPKGGALVARGHGSVTADNDGEWTVQAAEGPNPNNWRIKRIKAAATGDKHEFRLKVQKLGTDEDGDDITSLVVAEGGFTQSAEAGVQNNLSAGDKGEGPRMTPDGRIFLADNLTTALRALQKALDTVGDDPPAGVRAPFKAKVVTQKDWKEEIIRTFPGEDKQSEAFRKRVDRFFEPTASRLQIRGFIQIDGNSVWRTNLRVASVDPAHPSKNETKASDLSHLSPEDRAALSGAEPIPF